MEKKQFEVDLLNMYRTTKLFCNENPDVILTNADKGNVAVAIKKQDYINKIEETLQDKNIY